MNTETTSSTQTGKNADVLCVENLRVDYGAIQAIKGISFSVKRGEVVSLIGCNGAGKTSTLLALSGVLPCQGSIRLNGLDITRLPSHRRVALGLAHSPEGRGVFPNLTVHENLLMGGFSLSSKSTLAKNLEKGFSRFPRLKERRNQLAGTLSGGEQQMLAIARALMIDPEVLLLDEPSLGLAPIIVSQIFEVIAELNQLGTTILLVEQNARLALKKSHRAYVLETGHVKLSGVSSDLLGNEDVQKAYLGG